MPPPVKPAPRPNDKDDAPAGVRAYLFHGLLLDNLDKEQATGECPWCDSPKFAVSTETSKARCWKCSWTGNSVGFLRRLHADGLKRTTDEQYQALAERRGLLHGSTLRRWGACVSPLDRKTWLLPGYSVTGGVCQVYRYVRLKGQEKESLLATPGLSHGLHGPDPDSWAKTTAELADVYEGPWDGMAADEALGGCKKTGDGRLVATSSRAASLASKRLVLAVPGCNVFKSDWVGPLKDKDLRVFFDNDHPKKLISGQTAQAGLDGCRAVVRVISGVQEQPRSTQYLAWGEGGYDPSLPSGYDVRDHLRSGGGTAPLRAAALLALEERLRPVPTDWLGGKTGGKTGQVQIQPLACTSWNTLRQAWMKALKWTPGLEGALVCMLSSIASTGLPGDQLWFQIISPPSGGKSTLCEGVAVAKSRVKSVSTLKGFHSGYQTDKDGTEDNSLVSRLNGMTLVLKDGDTLLQQPNLGQILAEARDVYDRVARTSYRNKVNREYEGLSLTFLLCGTGSLRGLDSSELGQRFLTWVIMEKISEELEKEVNTRKLDALRKMWYSGTEGSRDGDGPETLLAKRLTGGYVEHLRATSGEARASLLEPSDQFLETISTLARYVAIGRARPSKTQQEDVNRELSTRVATQLFVLAGSAAMVLNLPGPDCPRVRELLRQVALHTARGRTARIMDVLAEAGKEGHEAKAVAVLAGEKSHECKDLLIFLRRIEAVEAYQPTVNGKQRGAIRYRLTASAAAAHATANTPEATDNG